MMTAIFPDLHNPSERMLDDIESAITRERPDRVTFLGDYFDDWDDTTADSARTAAWLKQSTQDQRRTHLIGNHDASYLFPHEATYCPGYTREKEAAIRSVLGADCDRRFKFHEWVDGWLVSHAGLSRSWVPEGLGVEALRPWLAREAETARENYRAGRLHWFSAVGKMRGGTARAGGLLWCDHRELEPVAGVRQIYGHTPGTNPRWRENNLCLDTCVRGGPTHFAMVTDGEVEIRSFSH